METPNAITQELQKEAQDALSGVTLALECERCQAQILVEMREVATAKCHWCGTTLSVNRQVPLGAVANGYLPYKLTRDQGIEEVRKFLSLRRMFAPKGFYKKVSAETVTGTYLPLLLIDASAHVAYEGQGEHMTRKYQVKGAETKEVYDADFYNTAREFDLVLQGYNVELTTVQLYKYAKWVNLMIEGLSPFEMEQATGWQMANLRGYSADNLNVKMEGFARIIEEQVNKAAKEHLRATLTLYDRGNAWKRQEIVLKGQQARLIYLPVWLYGFLDKNEEGEFAGFVGVDGRKRKAVGRVPIDYKKLYIASGVLEFVGLLLAIFVLPGILKILGLLLGVALYVLTRVRYEGWLTRSRRDELSKAQINGERKVDQFLQKEAGISNEKILGFTEL